MAKKSYSELDKRQAAALYVLEGNAERVGKAMAIPPRTVRDWVHAEWWGELVERARAAVQDELDAAQTAVIHKAMDVVQDRLEHGDVKLVRDRDENGEPAFVERRVPVSGKDAAVIGAVTFDKRQILRNAPILSGTNKALAEITKQLEEIGRAERARMIEGQKA